MLARALAEQFEEACADRASGRVVVCPGVFSSQEMLAACPNCGCPAMSTSVACDAA
jgi:hypothetical protein